MAHRQKVKAKSQSVRKIRVEFDSRLIQMICSFDLWKVKEPLMQPTHTYPDHQPFFISFLHPLRNCSLTHSLLPVQFMCLTVLLHNLSPSPLWSTSWSWTLYFILVTSNTHTHTHTCMRVHTTILQFSGLCPGQPEWAGTRRYILPYSGFSGAKWRQHRQMQQQSGWTATPSRLTGAPISAIPTIFMPDALPGTNLPIYPGLDRHRICWLAYPVAWLHQTIWKISTAHYSYLSNSVYMALCNKNLCFDYNWFHLPQPLIVSAYFISNMYKL